jgi:hypothetical protein
MEQSGLFARVLSLPNYRENFNDTVFAHIGLQNAVGGIKF